MTGLHTTDPPPFVRQPAASHVWDAEEQVHQAARAEGEVARGRHSPPHSPLRRQHRPTSGLLTPARLGSTLTLTYTAAEDSLLTLTDQAVQN
jgi:hypothetical protein